MNSIQEILDMIATEALEGGPFPGDEWESKGIPSGIGDEAETRDRFYNIKTSYKDR